MANRAVKGLRAELADAKTLTLTLTQCRAELSRRVEIAVLPVKIMASKHLLQWCPSLPLSAGSDGLVRQWAAPDRTAVPAMSMSEAAPPEHHPAPQKTATAAVCVSSGINISISISDWQTSLRSCRQAAHVAASALTASSSSASSSTVLDALVRLRDEMLRQIQDCAANAVVSIGASLELTGEHLDATLVTR